jgi:hypothetical protein
MNSATSDPTANTTETRRALPGVPCDMLEAYQHGYGLHLHLTVGYGGYRPKGDVDGPYAYVGLPTYAVGVSAMRIHPHTVHTLSILTGGSSR